MGSQEFERRDSRKRRRLSERRRVFSRLSDTGGINMQDSTPNHLRGSMGSTDRSWSNSSQPQNGYGSGGNQERSGSPSSFFGASDGSNNKISMKIQFHITVAPDNEPLILDTNHIQYNQQQQNKSSSLSSPSTSRQKSTESSIGEHIHERLLNRQNTLSTRRRQQLLALHNQSATEQQTSAAAVAAAMISSNSNNNISTDSNNNNNNEQQTFRSNSSAFISSSTPPASSPLGREAGARSSTITGGIADEATIKFLDHHDRQHLNNQMTTPRRSTSVALNRGSLSAQLQSAYTLDSPLIIPRENIYFKRDGQRFGHEFTLKLSVDRTYRCLLKVRPLIPLQGISIQGHQALFVDCSQPTAGGDQRSFSGSANFNRASADASPLVLASGPGSAPTGLNRSWQNIHTSTTTTISSNSASPSQRTTNPLQQHLIHNVQSRQSYQYNHSNSNHSQRLLHHQQASDSFILFQQQQSQMMRHFAASHCSSTNPHLGGQLIYMFDWSASRFEVNKNKARTQLQTVLKFKNGQILSLPLQVKFYQPECKQHLSWGSQLHFIDYECSINNMGQMNVDRVQYY